MAGVWGLGRADPRGEACQVKAMPTMRSLARSYFVSPGPHSSDARSSPASKLPRFDFDRAVKSTITAWQRALTMMTQPGRSGQARAAFVGQPASHHEAVSVSRRCRAPTRDDQATRWSPVHVHDAGIWRRGTSSKFLTHDMSG